MDRGYHTSGESNILKLCVVFIRCRWGGGWGVLNAVHGGKGTNHTSIFLCKDGRNVFNKVQGILPFVREVAQWPMFASGVG